MSANSIWVLKGIAGEFQGNSLPLTLPVMTLGRTSQNHIVISDTNISRVHATFYLEDECVFIQDDKSRNGIFVNTTKIEPHTRVLLKHGDRISIGPHAFLIEAEEKAATLNTKIHSVNMKEPTSYTSTKKTLFPFAGFNLSKLSSNRRAMMYIVAVVVVIFVLMMRIPETRKKQAPGKNDSTTAAAKAPDQKPLALDATELSSLKAQAKATLQYRDYLAATELYEKIVRAQPTDEYAKNQYEFAKKELQKQIDLHLELAKREYEKLNYERAIIEWKQVLALTFKSNPDIYRQTEQKISDAEKELQKRR